jgi:hypothetical protein
MRTLFIDGNSFAFDLPSALFMAFRAELRDECSRMLYARRNRHFVLALPPASPDITDRPGPAMLALTLNTVGFDVIPSGVSHWFVQPATPECTRKLAAYARDLILRQLDELSAWGSLPALEAA